MLCWANENWTKAWDGKNNDIIVHQDYSLEDDLNHIRFLLNIFEDPRYIRIDNKPVSLSINLIFFLILSKLLGCGEKKR